MDTRTYGNKAEQGSYSTATAKPNAKPSNSAEKKRKFTVVKDFAGLRAGDTIERNPNSPNVKSCVAKGLIK